MVDWKKALSKRAVNAICNEFEVGGVNSLCHWRDRVEEFDFNIRDHRDLYVDHPTWMIINFGIKSQKEVDSFLVAHWPETNVRFHPDEKSMDRRDGYLREQTRVLNPAEKLIKQIDLFSEAVNADWFSHNHIYAFAYICKLQPIPLRDLQQRMGVEKSLLNRLVHSLGDNPRGKFKGANLVTVRVMPHDRRQREVRLTHKGEALMDVMFPEEGKNE
jgi:DNA-binding MarR family transcriptional regulator